MANDKAVTVRETPGALEAQQAILTQRTPPEVIKTRKGKGGKMFSYVPHGWVTNQLNAAFNWAWSWEITEWRIIPEDEPAEVFVLGKLTVHSANGDLVKSQFGASDVKRNSQGQILSIGDDLKAASSDALKKAASLLGLALDLYWNAEDDEAPEGSGNGDKGNLSTDPVTAYWAAAKAKGLNQADGAAYLKKWGNDPNRALRELMHPNPTPATTEAPGGPKTEPPKPVNGNAAPPKSKPASIGGSKQWKALADALAGRCLYYRNANGTTNYPHMLGAAGKCGWDVITDENVGSVITDIEAYANKAANEAAQ